MEVTMFEIDPVKYGVLWQKVESYEAKFDEIISFQTCSMLKFSNGQMYTLIRYTIYEDTVL